MAFRRKKGSKIWHFCTNCSNWPEEKFDSQYDQPTDGEFCSECISKKQKSRCNR